MTITTVCAAAAAQVRNCGQHVGERKIQIPATIILIIVIWTHVYPSLEITIAFGR